MIKKWKQRLFNSYFLASLLFFSCLFVFFFYAFKFQTYLFPILALAYFVLAVFLYILLMNYRRRETIIFLQSQDYAERINLINNNLKNEILAIDSLHQQILNYNSLKCITERFSRCLSLDETVHAIFKETSNLLGQGGRTCILYLSEAQQGELSIVATKKGQEHKVIKAKKGDIFDSWVMKKLQTLIVEDTKKDFRFDFEKASSLEEVRKIRSLISSPLIIGRRVLGILRVDSYLENSFTLEDLRLLTTISDISAMAIENAYLYERAEELALKDGLTGLYLRRYMLERLSEEISRHLRKKTSVSILIFDIDYFKVYNDKFGHVAGDIVLKTIAKLLRENFSGAGNVISRFGGEEFAVILPNCTKENAFSLADKIRKKIKEEVIFLRKKATYVAVSVGVASCPNDSWLKDELILKADSALYQAKQSGRDRVCTA
ncbi:MAG: sensor domain-containing diguanylate cyclase [Candidatus Omnitrophota bacterium]|nr:sensor domain-containing diguanylate cyclase [Candidatus Omnitrophota bacterium]